MATTNSSKRTLLAGTLAAIGASACCVGPLVLLALGIGGTWISYLTAMEPYRPVFLVLTLVFLGLAFRKLYLQPVVCDVDGDCATPKTRRNQRIMLWVITVLLLALVTFPWYGVWLMG